MKETNESWLSLGSEGFHRSKSEKDNLKYRRSIYFIRDLKKGDKITREDIKRIRPGYGLEPKYFDLMKLYDKKNYRLLTAHQT